MAKASDHSWLVVSTQLYCMLVMCTSGRCSLLPLTGVGDRLMKSDTVHPVHASQAKNVERKWVSKTLFIYSLGPFIVLVSRSSLQDVA